MQATVLAPQVTSLRSPRASEELQGSIPTPFPRELISPCESISTPPVANLSSQVIHEDVSEAGPSSPNPNVAVSPPQDAGESYHAEIERDNVFEVMPSLEHLRESCVTALLDLFSQIGLTPHENVSLDACIDPTISSLDQILLKIRTRDSSPTAEPYESLLGELGRRVAVIASSTLQSPASDLALSLTSLLVNIERLSSIPAPFVAKKAFRQSLPVPPSPTQAGRNVYETLGRRMMSLRERRSSTQDTTSELEDAIWAEVDRDMEAILRLCRERTPSPAYTPERAGSDQPTPTMRPMDKSSEAAWFDHLPPEYEFDDLPEYDLDSKSRDPENEKEKEPAESTMNGRASSEKMRLDFDAITTAIDRLYLVAPQLHNQRVELNRNKLAQMETARRSGGLSARGQRLRAAASESNLELDMNAFLGRGRIVNQTAEASSRHLSMITPASSIRLDAKGKGRAREEDSKLEDLDRILSLLGKTAGEQRRISDQRVDMGDLKTRMDRAKVRDQKHKENLVDQIVRHSSAGRLSAQDAVFSSQRNSLRMSGSSTRETMALLSLPEFMKESVPSSSIARTMDPDALLTLPEFFEQQTAEEVKSDSSHEVVNPPRKGSATTPVPYAFRDPVALIKRMTTRTRSNSAPPISLSWLKYSPNHSSSRLNVGSVKPAKSIPMSRAASATATVTIPSEDSFQVLYVAEYQQTLQAVQLFLRLPKLKSPAHVDIEVPQSEDGPLTGNNKFVVRIGQHKSPEFPLPAPVLVGPQDVKINGDYYEVKLTVPPLATLPPSLPEDPHHNLLDAAQLTTIDPTSFACASCSLPVVNCERVERYNDLPSAHWEELMDAWMCHADQKLSDEINRHRDGGFNPGPGQAFVGGSYLLLDESALVTDNLLPREESGAARTPPTEFLIARCLCGAMLGRSQRSGPNSRVSYRLAKYALRVIRPSLESIKVPLPAFVVADMLELQQAHATHRFIITDEEDEKPRILIWLFNPAVQLSYASPSPATPHYALAEDSAHLHAAKVFYTLVGSSTSNLTDEYPAFKEAEELSYPMDVCRRLAALLKESNLVYPGARRTMMQLDVGWLQRA